MERNVFLYGLLILGILNLVEAGSSGRLPRSPQFGGGSFSQANAQAGAFSGGPPRPVFYPGGSFGGQGYGYGHGRGYDYGRPGLGGQRFVPGAGGPGGLSISVSKSVSIGRGGAAQSSSNAFGK